MPDGLMKKYVQMLLLIVSTSLCIAVTAFSNTCLQQSTCVSFHSDVKPLYLKENYISILVYWIWIALDIRKMLQITDNLVVFIQTSRELVPLWKHFSWTRAGDMAVKTQRTGFLWDIKLLSSGVQGWESDQSCHPALSKNKHISKMLN